MENIVGTKKMPEGILVMWGAGSGVQSDTFTFQELIDMKVNTLDLLDRPAAYRVDPKAHAIVPKR